MQPLSPIGGGESSIDFVEQIGDNDNMNIVVSPISDLNSNIETLRDELPCGDLPDDVWPETLHWTPMQGAKGWTAEVSR